MLNDVVTKRAQSLNHFIKQARMLNKQFKRSAIIAAVQVKKYIDSHPGTSISTATLAWMQHISRNALQEAFKHRFEFTVGQYKLLRRMDEARRLLKAGRPLKEVSWRLHYSSPSSFSNAFSKFYGITPSAWVRQQKTNANKQV
jgi:AraC-like DNA-binding protein